MNQYSAQSDGRQSQAAGARAYPDSQYQHFVPRFLLRNFAHPYKPPGQDTKKSKRSKGKHEKGKFPGDPVVHHVNLQSDIPTIDESPVGRVLGQMDMYRDTTKPSKMQQEVEQMFSKLESQASAIFRKITKSFDEEPKAGVWLTRDERDLLRKFLFLLKYRGPRFHQRFYHDKAEGYYADDRERLWAYMREKGFRRPVDVWFHNLKTIMELKMDARCKWVQEIKDTIYPPDADWFFVHVQSLYMAICTPSCTEAEFVLTDNSFNIFEGPNQIAKNAATGKAELASWTSFHEFAPISPKLMIVLRSFLLPVPEEDGYEKAKEARDLWRTLAVDPVFGAETKSVLADLPITKARNNYSRLVDGKLRLCEGEDGTHHKDHKFLFSYFPISKEQVFKINSILLDNACVCTAVVFGTQESLAESLEWYLTAPGAIGKKTYGDDDPKLACLKKLATVSKALGSTNEPLWNAINLPIMVNYEDFRLGRIELNRFLTALQKLSRNMPSTETGMEGTPSQVYKTLGGTQTSLLADLEQSERMRVLRIKIDMWSQGLDESLRDRNRLLLIDAYVRLPACRVWVYLKGLRYEMLYHPYTYQAVWERILQKQANDDGPEDIIAKASFVVRPERLNHLMFISCMNDVEREGKERFDPWAPVASNIAGMFRLRRMEKVVFWMPGTICNCGIPEIELAAKKQKELVIREQLHQQGQFAELGSILGDEEKIELLTRIRARSGFTAALKKKLEPEQLRALKAVLFDVAFPTPPMAAQGAKP